MKQQELLRKGTIIGSIAILGICALYLIDLFSLSIDLSSCLVLIVEYDRSIMEYNRNIIEKSYPLRRRQYYLDILDNEGISPETYDYFRKQLIKLGFIDFEVGESFVSFTIDGMLDNCYGAAYSVSGDDHGSLDCGRVVVWRKIRDNWYRWGTT